MVLCNRFKKLSCACVDHNHFFHEPSRSHKYDAGADLYMPSKVVIKPGRFFKININTAVKIPKGFVGLILPRSSVSMSGIHICTGVIDAGFTGGLMVTAYNFSCKDVELLKGNRIAQLVVVPCLLGNFVEIPLEELQKQKSDNRGACGFGSTGK